MIRAGRSRTACSPRSALTGAGGAGRPPELTAGANTRRWARVWNPWITRIGTSRRRCTALRCRSSTLPSRSGPANAFAAATASWTARLIPTPPTGAPFVRLSQAREQERQQIKWFAYAAAVMVAGFLLSPKSVRAS